MNRVSHFLLKMTPLFAIWSNLESNMIFLYINISTYVLGFRYAAYTFCLYQYIILLHIWQPTVSPLQNWHKNCCILYEVKDMIIQKEDRNEEKVTYSSERRVLFPSRKVYPLLLENSVFYWELCCCWAGSNEKQ